jgi:hypothetical protein
VRQLNPRNPSGHFSHRSYFFNVTRKPKVPAPFPFFCVFVNLINMNLPPVGIKATKLKRRPPGLPNLGALAAISTDIRMN